MLDKVRDTLDVLLLVETLMLDLSLMANIERYGTVMSAIRQAKAVVCASEFMQHLVWNNKESNLVADCRVFSVYRNLAQAPNKDDVRDFYVLKLRNWANVIPITQDGNIVFVKQYRHGTSQVTLEIPGGIVDLEDSDTKETASRELFEETGYKSDELIFLGRHNPNPALQDNFCDTYLALHAEQIALPTFDKEGYEQIELCLMPISSVPQLIANGDIIHGVVITAFYYLNLYENKISISTPI